MTQAKGQRVNFENRASRPVKPIRRMESMKAVRPTKSMRSTAPLAEPQAPQGAVHIRHYIRSTWAREKLAGAVGANETSGDKNLNTVAPEPVSLYIPVGKHCDKARLQQIIAAYPGESLELDDGVVLMLDKGVEIVGYSNFTQRDAWDSVLRSIATFFVDEARFQLTIKSNGRVYYRTTQRGRMAPSGNPAVSGTQSML